MERKFQLLSINREAYRLLFKTLAVSAFLWLAIASDFSWWSIILFFGSVFLAYIGQISERNLLRSTFWIFPLVVLAGFWIILKEIEFSFSSPFTLFFFVGLFLLFTFSFFILMGISRFFFSNRFAMYGILNTAVLLSTFSLFFVLTKNSIAWIFPFFFLVFFLFREAFRFFEVRFEKRVSVASAVSALLASELLIVLSLTPLGVMNSSVFLSLFFLLMRDSLVGHFHGNMPKGFLYRQMAIFVFISLIIFASSRWSL